MRRLSGNEELILLAIWRLQGDAYGVPIRNLLSDITKENWSIAGVYGPLKRMTKAGLVTAETGAPTPERGGKRKRFYRLTDSGLQHLSFAREIRRRMWDGQRNVSLEVVR